jgi:hypothetical protein
MRNLMLVSTFLALVVFSGCDDRTIETRSGEIPREYVAMARGLAGVWTGVLSGGVVDSATRDPVVTRGTFSLEVPNVRPIVSFTREDGRGSDLLLPDCGSRIGQMTSIEVHGRKEGTLIGVNFEFDPGNCASALDGRNLQLQFSGHKGVVFMTPSIFAFPGRGRGETFYAGIFQR